MTHKITCKFVFLTSFNCLILLLKFQPQAKKLALLILLLLLAITMVSVYSEERQKTQNSINTEGGKCKVKEGIEPPRRFSTLLKAWLCRYLFWYAFLIASIPLSYEVYPVISLTKRSF